MSDNNIDHLFKKALQDQGCEPPVYIWENIEKHLAKRKQVVVFRWARGIAAAALIAAFIGLWQFKSNIGPEITTDLANWDIPSVSIPYQPTKPESEERLKSVVLTTNTINKEINVDKKTEIVVKEVDKPANIVKLKETEILNGIRFAPALNLRTSRREFIPLTSKEALKNNETYLALLNQTSETEKAKEKIKIALSGHFVPAYSSGTYSSSVKNSRGNSYSGSQMNGIMNTGGGLRVAVNTGKRFSIQTGLFYSRMGQSTTENSDGVRTSGAFSGGSSERCVTSPLGNIKTRRKAVAYRSSEAIVLNSLGTNEETLEQVFGSLEIPLHVRYKLNDNKILFSVSGGFSGNFIVNNKVYLKSNNERELLGSTEDIRNFNISTDWGLGVEYPVGRKIKIMIEPGFKYYLQSLSQREDINYKPYLFTLSTGIGIEF